MRAVCGAVSSRGVQNCAAGRKIEAARHDADDLMDLIVDAGGEIVQRRAVEPLLPEVVADDGRARAADRLLVGD